MDTTKPLQIFKPGRHTAMSGASLSFSESDLAASAAAYDPARFEAPIVVGHPTTDAPAYGWVKSLGFAEGALEAQPDQVDPAFAEMVSAGRFKKISASFYSPDSPNNPVPGVYYLRHVGFLGAQAPAVKGLRAPEFAASEEGIVEFSEWDDVTNGSALPQVSFADLQGASLWRSMRDWFIGRFGQDEADKVIPGYQVSTLENSANQEVSDAAITPSFSESDDTNLTHAQAGASPAESTQEATQIVTPEDHSNNGWPQQKTALEAENVQLKAQIAASDAKAKTAVIHAANTAFAETLITSGQLFPAEQGVAVAALDHFATQEQPVEFGEGDAKKPLIEGFKTFLHALPKRIEFGEVATHGRVAATVGSVEFSTPAGHSVDGQQLELHRKALAHQASHPGTDYISAVRAVS